MTKLLRAAGVCLLLAGYFAANGQNAIVEGFNSTTDNRNDDGTWTLPSGCNAADDGEGSCPGTKVDLGFAVNFFGLTFTQVYINTNGNITFDSPLASYTPFSLTSTNRQIIAPFFADVDTRSAQSGRVTFGQGTFGGRKAFGVTWPNAGYYYQRADKRNTFQVILVERSDTGVGNFDIVFNYNSIQWETGEAATSGGIDGLGGRSARAGFSNGTGAPGSSLELRGSAEPGAFLDSNPITGLVHDSLNSNVPGRYIFFARNGEIIAGLLSVSGPCPLPTGAVGVAYTPFKIAVSGGTAPYTFTADLPPGLALDNTTLTVSGTPTVAGTFPISIKVTDSAPGVLQQTREYACTMIVVGTPPPLQLTGPCNGALQNRPYWVQLTVVGGSGGHTFAYNGPPWLAPAASAPSPGRIGYTLAGTPTFPGTFPVKVTVQDSQGHTAAYECSINVAGNISIAACPPSPIPIETPFRYDLQTAGGAGEVVWSLTRGQLPAGLTLLSTGRINGTPSGPPGISIFTVTASAGQLTADRTCSLTVSPPPLRLITGCPPNGDLGVPYGPFTLTASGGLGAGSYLYTISGALPEGLLFTGDSIAGTPARVGSSSFTIHVSSGDQTVASAPCTVRIGPEPVRIGGSCPSPLQQVGVPLSVTFTAVGGEAPYRFSMSGSSWLSHDNGTVSGTPPESAQSGNSFTISVIDNGGRAADKMCVFNVAPATPRFAVNGVCPPPLLARGAGIDMPLVLTDGQAPFSWTYDKGNPDLALASTTGQRNSLKGTVNTEGGFSFIVGAADFAGAQAVPLRCDVLVDARGLPGMAIAAAESPEDLLDPLPLSLTLAAPAPLDLTGSVSLSFSPSAAFPMDNPEVAFDAGERIPFTIPAGTTSIALGHLLRGTAAGSIRVHITDLAAGAGKMLPSPAPSLDVAVPSAPPVFAVSIEETNDGFDVVLEGYSTTRDILAGAITLNPREGSSSPPVTVDLNGFDAAAMFADHYRNRTAGGSFSGVRIPIAVAGDRSAFESATVVLTNSAGTSEVTQRR